jgi:excisionase family DNA binding protein
MITAEMLAERWLVHPSTVYRMIARGEVPCRKIGRLVRIPLSHVERLELEAPCRAVTVDTTSASTSDPADGKLPGRSPVVAFDPGARAQRIGLSLRKS